MDTLSKVEELSVQAEVARLGRELFIRAMGVSTQQVSNVIRRGRFPEGWLLRVEGECAEAGVEPPPRSLYGAPVSPSLMDVE